MIEEERVLNKERRAPSNHTKKHTIERSGPLKMASFGWLNELMWVSQTNPWTQEMNYNLPAYDRVEKNKKRLLKAFHSRKTCLMSILLAYLPEFLIFQVSKIIFTILNTLAQKKTSEVGAMISKGSLYQDPQAVLTFAWLLVLSEGFRFAAKTILGYVSFMMQRAGINARTGMYSILQDKIMSFSPLTSREISEGFITNLIQVDAMAIDGFYSHFSSGVSLFLGLGVSLYFMVAAIEWRLSSGYMVAVIGIRVLFVLIFAAITYYQNRYLRAKDRRMDLLKNVLGNVDFVKTNSMENFFCLELYEKREEELMELRSIAVAMSIFEFFKRALMKVPSLIIIILVVYFIPSEMTFANYLFFLQLGTTLNTNLSGVFDSVKFVITDCVSLNRIDRFLLAREKDQESQFYRRVEDEDNLVAVEVMAGNFRWRHREEINSSKRLLDKIKDTKRIKKSKTQSSNQNDSKLSDQLLSGKYTANSASGQDGSPQRDAQFVIEEDEFYLADINLKVKKGETVVILGKNCSGRSSLLYSLLGEMVPATEQSTVIVNGSVAFLSQTRWLLGMSVKENILLGKEYEEERMIEALKCSQLERDLEDLQNGLDTFVGDNGDTVSGGQRARIVLARCFYQK